MAYTYHIKRKAALDDYDVYYEGGTSWSDDFDQRKKYTAKATADAVLVNTDGKNGGFSGAVVVREE
tara:strand:- start:397 stop:594 length:198 start_codon:yes stop_codon:yes gene_type:complete